MFQLRDEHTTAFSEASYRSFQARAIQHLRRFLPKQTAPFSDDQLGRRIDECTDRAARYGLTGERQVMHFVDSTYLAGDHFDTALEGASARTVLFDRDLQPDTKAEMTLIAAREIAGRKSKGD